MERKSYLFKLHKDQLQSMMETYVTVGTILRPKPKRAPIKINTVSKKSRKVWQSLILMYKKRSSFGMKEWERKSVNKKY